MDYNPFVTLVTNRPNKTPIEEIHSLLLSYEFRINAQNSFEQLSSLQANLYQLNTHPKSYKSPYPSQSQNRSHTNYVRSSTPLKSQLRIIGKPQANKFQIH